MTNASSFIDEITEQARPLYIANSAAFWESATTGTEQARENQERTQLELTQFWGDTERYATAKKYAEVGNDDDIAARTLKVIHLASAKAQQDPETMEQIIKLEASVRQAYFNYRAEIGGEKVSDNQLDEIISKSRSSAEVQEAWEASKIIGAEVAEEVRQLARLRNKAAQAQGYRDHFQRSLHLNEIDEVELLDTFKNLEQTTRAPFYELKADIDRRREAHFGISQDSLMPWHFADRFFQSAPDLTDVDLDALFVEADPVELSTATYDGIGLEVSDIVSRSDLYEREGKNQHAFCIDMNREGDVRTLNNLQPNHRWNETLLHELGHAVYDEYIDRDLPWMLRKPPHTLSTEAIAIMMGSLTYDERWLREIAGVESGEAAGVAVAAQLQERAQRLIFARWVLVMTHFERAMYADPEADLDRIWWGIVEQFQGLKRPANRSTPDWAAKYHIPLAPVYYHNYQLGVLVMSQILNRIDSQFGGITGRPEAGQWLRQYVFEPGASRDWAEHVVYATGEKLNAAYFSMRL